MSSATGSEILLVVGEVRTAFLRNSTELSGETVSSLLTLVPGEHVRHAHRPRDYAVSPESLTGVDCDLPALEARMAHGVGTVATRATLTDGRILQTCSYTTIVPSTSDYRRTWSHYLGRPGVVEALGKFNVEDAATAFAESERGRLGIELGQIAEATLNGLQDSPLLDGARPLRAPHGQWRWAIQPGEQGRRELYRFVVLRNETRLIRLSIMDADVPSLLTFVEDLALHDWLLMILTTQLGRAQLGSQPLNRALVSIRPVIDHVLHLWMPHARVARNLVPLWEDLDRDFGLSRSWDVSVARIRDQLLLANTSRSPDVSVS